ncbi:hypothetical protein ACLBX9_12785 [Methylobacterium sp. A49B]
METDVKDVGRWALVLSHIASSDHAIEGDDIHVISGVLFEIGKRLATRWDEAFEAARGER